MIAGVGSEDLWGRIVLLLLSYRSPSQTLASQLSPSLKRDLTVSHDGHAHLDRLVKNVDA